MEEERDKKQNKNCFIQSNQQLPGILVFFKALFSFSVL